METMASNKTPEARIKETLEDEFAGYLRDQLAPKHGLWRNREVQVMAEHGSEAESDCWWWRSPTRSVEPGTPGEGMASLHAKTLEHGARELGSFDSKRYMQCHKRARSALAELCDDAEDMASRFLRRARGTPNWPVMIRVRVIVQTTALCTEVSVQLLMYAPGKEIPLLPGITKPLKQLFQ